MMLRALAAWALCCRCSAQPGLLHVYDPELARQFAALASVTYCDGALEHVLDWSCRTCADAKTPLVPGKIRVVDAGTKNATRIIVAKLRDQHGCLMSFRGSDNIMNWLRDFQVWEVLPRSFKDCDGCKVHSGFLEIWSNVQDSVLRALRDLGCRQDGADNLLYITGHSLGAALTHLAMFALDAAGFNISKTYSFEAPRVGNDRFSEAFTERFGRKFPVFRITHSQDPVVHVPPRVMGYEHVETEVWYDKKGNWTVCLGTENSTCAERYRNLMGMVLFHAFDHCTSSLVTTGDICSPDCSRASASFIV